MINLLLNSICSHLSRDNSTHTTMASIHKHQTICILGWKRWQGYNSSHWQFVLNHLLVYNNSKVFNLSGCLLFDSVNKIQLPLQFKRYVIHVHVRSVCIWLTSSNVMISFCKHFYWKLYRTQYPHLQVKL